MRRDPLLMLLAAAGLGFIIYKMWNRPGSVHIEDAGSTPLEPLPPLPYDPYASGGPSAAYDLTKLSLPAPGSWM